MTTFATAPDSDTSETSPTENGLVLWKGTPGQNFKGCTVVLTDEGAMSGLAGISTSGDVVLSSLTASKVPYLDSNKKLAASSVTPTELGYLSGVTSALQTQITAKAPAASPTFTGTITANGTVVLGLADNTTAVDMRSPTQLTVGAAGAGSALPATPTGYLEIKIQGTAYVIPFYAKA